MPTTIKITTNESRVEFDKGAFDDWCVYVTSPGKPRFAPTDILYFTELQQLGKKHGYKKIYDDFVLVYAGTTRETDDSILEQITTIAGGYGDDKNSIDLWFTVIYAGMIAEENKQNAVLKKRIKRLGMYQLLIEGKTPDFAAGFSKGKTWRELDVVMKKCGF